MGIEKLWIGKEFEIFQSPCSGVRRTHVAHLIAHRWSDPLSVYTQCQWQFACNTYCKLFASTPIVHTITQSGLFTRNPNKYSDCIGNSLFSLPDRWNSGRQPILFLAISSAQPVHSVCLSLALVQHHLQWLCEHTPYFLALLAMLVGLVAAKLASSIIQLCSLCILYAKLLSYFMRGLTGVRQWNIHTMAKVAVQLVMIRWIQLSRIDL